MNELVDILHAAADDPTIGGIRGTFGHYGNNNNLSKAGWADWEEVRNALRLF